MQSTSNSKTFIIYAFFITVFVLASILIFQNGAFADELFAPVEKQTSNFIPHVIKICNSIAIIWIVGGVVVWFSTRRGAFGWIVMPLIGVIIINGAPAIVAIVAKFYTN